MACRRWLREARNGTRLQTRPVRLAEPGGTRPFSRVLLYLAVSIAFGIVNTVSGVAYLWLFGGSDMKELALADLRSSRLPGPRPYQAKRFEYLLEIADDEAEDAGARVKAGALYSSYQVAIRRSGFIGGLALAKALDEATLRYAAEAPE